jgi:hypothetical protein
MAAMNEQIFTVPGESLPPATRILA